MSAVITLHRVAASWFDDAAVVLRVDHSVLTKELATEINQFWSGADGRLSDEGGNVVRAVVRLFGAHAIHYFMRNGGASAKPHLQEICRYWTGEVLKAQGEGWPGLDELGILITAAEVNVVGFEDVTLEAA